MPQPPWVKQAAGTHPLMRELSVVRLVGWPLLVVTVLSGVACGLVVVALSEPSATTSERWVLVAGGFPVVYSLLARRSLLLGILGGVFASTIAFLTVALFAIWQVVCFVITFAGEC